MGSASPRLTDPAKGAAPRTSWPGSLVERGLALLAADFRRPAGPVIVAAVLAVFAVLARSTQAGPFDPAVAGFLGLMATAPIAVIRRFPGPAIGVVLTASAVFVIFGRLSWSAPAVAGWLFALAACPVVLRRQHAVLAVTATEVAVLLATLNLRRNATPWDATAGVTTGPQRPGPPDGARPGTGCYRPGLAHRRLGHHLGCHLGESTSGNDAVLRTAPAAPGTRRN